MSTAGRRIAGIHHVTAIASGPQPNLDFYARFLGLRLVKRTVNFDDPGKYHLYYGDETGRPGTLLTFFPWPGARRGRHGAGQITATAFAVPSATLDFWRTRAGRYGFAHSDLPPRFGDPVLRVDDPDGLAIELVASGAPAAAPEGAEIPADWAIQGIHSATSVLADTGPTTEMLAGMLGFREVGREGNRTRFAAGDGGFYDLLAGLSAPRGLGGAGVVHHIAFATSDAVEQRRWQQALLAAGFQVSPQMDRKYFQSIYFREPGGVLFEIATAGPGFLVDEPAGALGTSLQLPAEYEPRRAEIEAALPPLTVPTTGLVTESC